MNPMETFLKKGSFREIRITDHVSGNRVTLYDNFNDISSGVSDNIPKAFDDALRNFDSNVKRLKLEKLEKLEEEKKQMEIDFETLERKIKTAKEGLKNQKAKR
jgi:hypothetical protein